MEKKELIAAIENCVGMEGVTKFNTLPLKDFNRWLMDVTYDAKKSKRSDDANKLLDELFYMEEKQYYIKKYEKLCDVFGLGKNGSVHAWTELHCPSVYTINYCFCEANRKRFIAEYLMWEEFAENAKKYNIIYYYGIDVFLEKFKTLVYNRINLKDE